MTIVELCRIDDKKAHTFVDIAISEGRKVYKFRGHYVVLLAEDNYWRDEDAQFRSMPSGMYIIRDNQVYLVQ
jgi:hypothetical protein